MDVPTKRRSLPPLGLNNENDAPSPGRRRVKSKKKPEDASDSQQSGINRNATTLSEEQGNQSTDVTDGKKRARKKKRPTSGFDPDSGDGENMEDDAPMNSSKISNGAARRKRDSSARLQRIQRSVSDDGLASTDVQKSSAKKRRRPRSKLIESADEEAITPHGRQAGGRVGKPKRKKTPKLPGSGEDDYLADGEGMSTIEFLVSAEDIVTEDRTADANQPISATTLPSQPIPRLFMERKDGFKSEDKAKMAKRRQKEEMPQPMTSKTTTEVAIATHKASLTLSLYCHGLLAGFALWQCIVVYSLSQDISTLPLVNGDKSFLIHYSSLAQPTVTIYYLLLALCTVSVFDRFDIARPDKKLFRALLTFKSGAIAILLYFLALVFNVGLAAVDDRISLFTVSGEEVDFCVESEYEDPLWPEDDIEKRLSAWRSVNLVRALLSMFGWLLLALAPTTDFTTEHLYDSEEPLWEEQQQTELHQVQSNA
ncbi:transmembrane protein 237-like isoform X2 [Anneissia japonica]|uniref:transmembrane protein 237-like isoform X2 n=1 Tax=Anneissia japonica TaxID=1529436 RepID=UPI0014254D89|nr:transmembrane protein 237-like isoform X2 [Anneissia japonica]